MEREKPQADELNARKRGSCRQPERFTDALTYGQSASGGSYTAAGFIPLSLCVL